MKTISQIAQDKSISIDFLCSSLNISRATYYRHLSDNFLTNDPPFSSKKPINALTNQEKQQILALLHSKALVDKTPYEIYYALIDKGEYYCSPRTMYRILAEQGETKDRRNQRRHRDAIKPELIATRPNEVWSWNITK